jgi:hypothetical protein
MSTISITLSEPLREFVTKQAAEQGLAQPDEYIEKLVREEQKKKIWAYYEKEVGKAIDRNEWLTAEEMWEEIRVEREKRRIERQTRSAQ